MSDFTVYPQRDALVEDVLKLWPTLGHLDHAQKQALRSHIQGAVSLVWGTPAMHSAKSVLDTLMNPERLQAALVEFNARTQDVTVWADQFLSSPNSTVDDHKHAVALARFMR